MVTAIEWFKLTISLREHIRSEVIQMKCRMWLPSTRGSAGPNTSLVSQTTGGVCSCRLVTKIPETTIQKTSMTLEGQNCLAIWTNMKTKGETNNETETHCGLRYRKRQSGQYIYIYIYIRKTSCFEIPLFFSPKKMFSYIVYYGRSLLSDLAKRQKYLFNIQWHEEKTFLHFLYNPNYSNSIKVNAIL